MVYQKKKINLFQAWELVFLALWDKMVTKCPPKHGQIYSYEGTMPLQLLTFNTPVRSSGWKLSQDLRIKNGTEDNKSPWDQARKGVQAGAVTA